MIPETLISVIAAVATLASGIFVSSKFVRDMFYRILGKPEPKKTYAARLSELTHSLTNASREVDSILAELSRVAKAKKNNPQSSNSSKAYRTWRNEKTN